MHDDWQQTDQIVISVQTAELRQVSINYAPTLNLSCSLVNIARGQCIIEIAAGTPNTSENIGNLLIEIDRPVMRGRVVIPEQLYNSIISCLGNAPPRPISISLTIATKLAVSLEGDLRINEATQVIVTDLSVILPLR
tara:strand:+ start:799 stop:1209 length:411 start_codon:yes stop_codon:yes gene_type:complete